MAYTEGFDRNQAQMFPEYLEDYIDNENPVRVIDAFVNDLDLKKYKFTKIKDGGPGAPSYNPKDLLKLYIWHKAQEGNKKSIALLFHHEQ
ncbi:MAG: transposase [Clostridiaceae bacterium]|nr:transposase [Clostridiaceae bacterium]